jgi:sirohydrochlorin ferrochelatase
MLQPPLLLVDNGSLAPASILSARAFANQLTHCLNRPVEASGLLHVEKVAADKLNGAAAFRCETRLKQLAGEGIPRVDIAPMFIGPSLAISEYLPERLSLFTQKFPETSVHLHPVLIPSEGASDPIKNLCEVIAEAVREVLDPAIAAEDTAILICDHGSPIAPVAQVRDAVARTFAETFSFARTTLACSMERREGDAYAFNEPLLASALQLPEVKSAKQRIVALLFLLPGRHAGPGGDVDTICREVYPEGGYTMTRPLALQSGFTPFFVDHLQLNPAQPFALHV